MKQKEQRTFYAFGPIWKRKTTTTLDKREKITIIELVNTNSIYTIYYEEIIFDMQNILTGFSMEYVDAIITLKKIDPLFQKIMK